MAGAYLTIGAKYRPFSYEELIRPVAMATEMHAKIDEQYAALQEKAGVWENLANKETDPESYKKYKEYSDALRTQADNLAKNGLNSQSMRDMLNLRARYSSDIVPLEQAYTRRRQLADEQRKMIMQNPTLKFERDMNTISLDDFVKNPELDYGYSVNGAMIAQQASQAYAHLAKSIQEEPQYKHILNGTYYQSMIKSGYTPEQILALARNDKDAPEVLRQISQQIYDSTGVEDFIKRAYPEAASNGNQAMQAQEWRDYVNSYINQGAWSAVGTSQFGTMVDQEEAQRRALELQAAKAKASASGSQGAKDFKRTDSALFGTNGKGKGNTEKYMGSVRVNTPEASKLVLNELARAYNGVKTMRVVSGYDENGNLKYKEEKIRKFKEEDTDVIGLQIDYNTGDVYATVKTKNSNDTRSILIPRDSGTFDLDTQAAVNNAVIQNARLEEGIRKGYITNDEAKEYREKLKDAMFKALNSLFEYTGTLNINTDAGEKRSLANDAYSSQITVD